VERTKRSRSLPLLTESLARSLPWWRTPAARRPWLLTSDRLAGRPEREQAGRQLPPTPRLAIDQAKLTTPPAIKQKQISHPISAI
jgi:hypothetical protein